MRCIPFKSGTSMIRGLFVMVLIGSVGWAADATDKGRLQANFACSGGIYAGGCFDGVLGMLNTFRANVDSDINDRLRAGRKKGCINIVQLDYHDRWAGDREDAFTKIREWLKRTDLSLVDAVHLSEEQAHNAAGWLDSLYAEIKAHNPTLPVYVWPSYPLGPLGQADGYVYDAYGLGYMQSRRKFMQFLRTGKPLILCVDASGYSDFRAAREQVMTCHEFDIPVFYFAADNGSGSYNNWYGKSTAVLSTCRNFMFSALEFQRRCRGPAPIFTGDMIWGEQIELAPDEKGKIDYSWPEFGGATVYGFSRMRIQDGGIQLKDKKEAALDYQFWSLLPIKEACLNLSVDDKTGDDNSRWIRVEKSRCGKLDEWQTVAEKDNRDSFLYDLGDVGQEFRLRVTLAGGKPGAGMTLLGGRLTGRAASPPGKIISLDTYYDGWRDRVQFHQDLAAGLWRMMADVEHPQYLTGGTSLSIRGTDGHAVSVSAVEKFGSDHPLTNIVVRLTGWSHACLGGSFSMGVSLDGKTIIKQGTPLGEPRADGYYNGTHIADLTGVPEFQGVREFYVHMIQTNGSGIRGNMSSELSQLEIEAVREN